MRLLQSQRFSARGHEPFDDAPAAGTPQAGDLRRAQPQTIEPSSQPKIFDGDWIFTEFVDDAESVDPPLPPIPPHSSHAGILIDEAAGELMLPQMSTPPYEQVSFVLPGDITQSSRISRDAEPDDSDDGMKSDPEENIDSRKPLTFDEIASMVPDLFSDENIFLRANMSLDD